MSLHINPGLSTTAVKSAAYTAGIGERVLCDTDASMDSDTFTAATSDVLTFSSYTPADGDEFALTSSGTLPAGLSLATRYFAINSSSNTCKLSLTRGGSAVDITGTGSGTHTATLYSFPIRLPASPNTDAVVEVVLITDHATNTVLIDRNGNNVGGGTDTEYIRLVQENESVLFWYVGGNCGWKVYRDLNLSSGTMVNGSAQTIATSSTTYLEFDTTSEAHGVTASTSDNGIYVRRAGNYNLNVYISTSFGESGWTTGEELWVSPVVNGTTQQWGLMSTGSASAQASIGSVAPAVLAAGDFIRARTYQTSGGNWDTGTTALEQPRLHVTEFPNHPG